ncbi:MAG: hypothetical protein Q8K32_31230 [Archangium sp.]|nr:hypothetical protein [Archangium sp.]
MSTFAKRCKVCGKQYSRAEFFALPPPHNGIAKMHGLHWRNCPCGGTLVVPDEEAPNAHEAA